VETKVVGTCFRDLLGGMVGRWVCLLYCGRFILMYINVIINEVRVLNWMEKSSNRR